MNYSKSKDAKVKNARYSLKVLQQVLANLKAKYNEYKGLIKNLDDTEYLVQYLSPVEQIVRKHCYKAYVDQKKYYYKEIQNTKKLIKAAKEEWHYEISK